MDPRFPGRSASARVATLVAAGLLAVAAILQTGTLPSLAVLTDSASPTAQTVTAGTIALSLTNGAAAGQWTGSFSIVPGASQYSRLTVTNGGTLPLVYVVTSTTSAATLAPYLTITVAKLANESDACSSTTYAAGTVVSNGAPLAFGSSSGLDVIGSTAAGTGRTLAAKAVDNLCMRVDFPAGHGLGYGFRGTTATTSFSFSATQA